MLCPGKKITNIFMSSFIPALFPQRIWNMNNCGGINENSWTCRYSESLEPICHLLCAITESHNTMFQAKLPLQIYVVIGCYISYYRYIIHCYIYYMVVIYIIIFINCYRYIFLPLYQPSINLTFFNQWYSSLSVVSQADRSQGVAIIVLSSRNSTLWIRNLFRSLSCLTLIKLSLINQTKSSPEIFLVVIIWFFYCLWLRNQFMQIKRFLYS